MTAERVLCAWTLSLVTLWSATATAQTRGDGQSPGEGPSHSEKRVEREAQAEEPEGEVDDGTGGQDDAAGAGDDGSPDEVNTAERSRPRASASDRAAAESLRRVGVGLMELGQYEEACPKLEQSMEAAADGETAWALAECFDEQGKLASAWAAYRQARSLLRGDPRAEEASSRAIDLEPRVPKLTVVPTQALPGVQVWRDGTRFGVGLFGVPLATDPGVHAIEVRADGYAPWSTTVEIKASERVTVQVPALTRVEVSVGRDAAATGTPSTVRRDGRDALWYAGLIATGVGVGAVAAGGILGLVASRDVRAAEADDALCGADRRCTPAGLDAIEGADQKATASTVLVASGATVALAGFAVLLWPRGTVEEVGLLAPAVGPDGAGVNWKWRF